MIPNDSDRLDVDTKVQVVGHLADQGKLLRVFLTEEGLSVRIDQGDIVRVKPIDGAGHERTDRIRFGIR